MLGFYENFPQTIHGTETFSFVLSKRKLQKKIAKVFQEVNCNSFSFEEVGNPTVPNGIVIFEFGIADTDGFFYLNQEGHQNLQNTLDDEAMRIMDWFCAIRYYKKAKPKRKPLKFDYYMLRLGFAEKGVMQVTVFHEKGPRYLSPEDLVNCIERQVNQTSKRKILKRVQS
ncbi:MAG: hypothetical protein NWF00_07775 [Candidatus Bathyarchaeota archaeon]|nr:hypothetical protein [Candidatus Bathyarchaeota archaeon]